MCISTCPTGAMYERAALGQGQCKDLEKVRTVCPYCGVGCVLELNVNRQTNRVVRVTSPVGLRAQRRQPLRQGQVRLRVRALARAADHAAHQGERRVPRGELGRGTGARLAGGCGRSATSTVRTPSPSSARAAAPTRRTTSCRRWPAPPARPTTSTSAPPPATPLGGRAGQLIRVGGHDQLDRRDQGRRHDVHHRLQPDRGAPHHRSRDEEGAPGAGPR